MNVAGAIVAPIAMLASELLPHPILAHGFAAPRRVYCSSSLGRISYYEDAAASGLPLLLLHDVATPGVSASAFRALFEELRGERPIVVPDLLGHGFSQRGKRPFGRADHERFFEEVLGDVSRRYGATVDVVAVGTTSEIAAASIVRSSRHVRSLVLIAPTGLDAAAPWLVKRVRALVARHLLDLRDPLVAENAYDALRVPTLFVHGDAFDVPRADLAALSQGHASFRQSEVHGARIAPHVDRPRETADALRAFWRGLAMKPELRLIRGEKTEREPTAIRRRKWM
jgi:pimeloyl-ACP methyl ester carboxylesterase